MGGTIGNVEYTYDAASNRKAMLFYTCGTNWTQTYNYDTGERLYQIQNGATTIAQYGYDSLSRLDAIVHNLDGGGTSSDLTTTFAYNPASQIVTRAQSNSAHEFPVASTNRVYVTNGRNQYTQITGDAPATLTWDANGNLTSDGSTAFGYDTENRLTSASGAKSATLTYDPLGRLYQVTSAGVTTRFVYDGDRLIAEYNTAGTVQRRYVHGAGVDEPLVWYEGSVVSSATRRYLHTDHQGSVIATSNAAGAKLDIGTYDAYGVTTAPSTWRFQYTGQAAIPQLGLYYYKARFYNPALGRFMQTDPIGYDDDVNLYAYVKNDPLNNTDPTGRWCLPCIPPAIVAAEKAVVTVAAAVAVIGAAAAINEAKNGNDNAPTPDAKPNGATEPGAPAKPSDRPPGPDGKTGSTGGPGEGKRFPAESPETRAGKEGVPCAYCGQPTTNEPGKGNSRERDHIDPKSRGGNNSPENERDSCRDCNRSKGARNPDEWPKR